MPKITPFTRILLLCSVTVLTLVAATTVMASSDWGLLRSKFGLYTVRMPPDFHATKASFRTDPQNVVHAEEIAAISDQRPYKNVVKSFILKYEQTLGVGMGRDEIDSLLERNMNVYEDQYIDMKGILKKREILSDRSQGRRSGEIYISYEDPKLGQQGIRVRIVYLSTTKYQQIIMGPDVIMYGLEAKNFIESLNVSDGVDGTPGTLEEKWVMHTSPMMISSMRLPPISKVYMPKKPYTKVNDNSEITKVVFTDPARSQNLFYNIYGYRMDQPLGYEDALKFFMTRHVGKHIKNQADIKIQKYKDGRNIVFAVAEPIIPPKGFPYVRHTKLKMQHLGNYVVVQEMLGDINLTESAFGDNLMKTLTFHPLEAHKALKKAQAAEKAGAPAATPAPATPAAQTPPAVKPPTAPAAEKPAATTPAVKPAAPAETAPPAAQ